MFWHSLKNFKFSFFIFNISARFLQTTTLKAWTYVYKRVFLKKKIKLLSELDTVHTSSTFRIR